MFVALMAHSAFFKKHLKVFIAIAPVLTVHNCEIEPVTFMASSKEFMQTLKDHGPELAPDPIGMNPVFRNIAASNVGGGAQKLLAYLSDAEGEKTSEQAMINMAAHFPAGSSFKSLDHYTQCV